MKETEEKVLTAREVAERLGVSEFMILLHVTTGALPCVGSLAADCGSPSRT